MCFFFSMKNFLSMAGATANKHCSPQLLSMLPFTPKCIIQKPPQAKAQIFCAFASTFCLNSSTVCEHCGLYIRLPGSLWKIFDDASCVSRCGKSLIYFLLIFARPEITDCVLSCRPFTNNMICSRRNFSQSLLVPHVWVSVFSLSTSLLSPSNQESQITYQRAVNHCLARVAHVQLDQTQRVCGNC